MRVYYANGRKTGHFDVPLAEGEEPSEELQAAIDAAIPDGMVRVSEDAYKAVEAGLEAALEQEAEARSQERRQKRRGKAQSVYSKMKHVSEEVALTFAQQIDPSFTPNGNTDEIATG